MAQSYLNAIFPEADSIELKIFRETTFIDPGSNLETIHCPICATSIHEDGWGDAMDQAYSNKFRDLSVLMPCCGSFTKLNNLKFHWPAGFARFMVEIMNPLREMNDGELNQLEKFPNCDPTKIWAHY